MTPEPRSKASWKLDASLDEVIEAEAVDEWPSSGRAAAETKSAGRGQGGKSWRKEQAANYWNEESGWTYKTARPPPAPRGGKGWEESSWEEWDDWDDWDSGWSGKGSGKGSTKGRGKWWEDSSYGSGWQEASASSWAPRGGDGWSAPSSWGKGRDDEWRPKQAVGDRWTNGNGWGGSFKDGSSSWGPAWQDGRSKGGSSSSYAGGKGGGGWGGEGGGYSTSKPDPEPAVRGSARAVGVPNDGRAVAIPRGSAGAFLNASSQHPADVTPGASGARKHRLEEVPAPPPQGQPAKRVKVTNIPADLPQRDIRDAFEAATGRISNFEMDRGTAYITFLEPRHAVKAMDTFDRGELNGNIISVKVLP